VTKFTESKSTAVPCDRYWRPTVPPLDLGWHSALTNPRSEDGIRPIPTPRAIRAHGGSEGSPGVVEGADLVGVERHGLAGLVPVVGAVGRRPAGRREEGDESEERRHRSRSGGVEAEVAGRGFGGRRWRAGRSGRGRCERVAFCLLLNRERRDDGLGWVGLFPSPQEGGGQAIGPQVGASVGLAPSPSCGR
jgi:hypothetical protein